MRNGSVIGPGNGNGKRWDTAACALRQSDEGQPVAPGMYLYGNETQGFADT